ncbi:alpha/beta fold hydrolase [Occallatibacter savannae]|uniref:alpha/beta fold hydrolase n=1 Tax=Occallatibacter savannae TaxID=1002691 RepID=UPI000D69093F|nr:alpha/beta hydrolase [Occallatibacter savannae]
MANSTLQLEDRATSLKQLPRVFYRTETVDGLNIFYREAGSKDAPAVVLLHGFPSSSHMYRNLIPILATKYHVIAPDYPGFGYSDAPAAGEFEYTFDHLAKIIERFLEQKEIEKYSVYIQDYGSPVGFRLAAAHPERVQAIISQNGNAYEEGLSAFWGEYLQPYWKDRNETTEAKMRGLLSLEATRMQYLTGVRNPEQVSPDAWQHDQALLDRAGNPEIQLDLFYDYRNNLPLYPAWHEYLRTKQPPVLLVWGKNDQIFIEPGARAFLRDRPDAELHLLDTGHFALEEDSETIGGLMLDFLKRKVK